MKMKLTALLLCLLLLAGCGAEATTATTSSDVAAETTLKTPNGSETPDTNGSETPGDATDLGGDGTSFGDAIQDTGAYDG